MSSGWWVPPIVMIMNHMSWLWWCTMKWGFQRRFVVRLDLFHWFMRRTFTAPGLACQFNSWIVNYKIFNPMWHCSCCCDRMNVVSFRLSLSSQSLHSDWDRYIEDSVEYTSNQVHFFHFFSPNLLLRGKRGAVDRASDSEYMNGCPAWVRARLVPQICVSFLCPWARHFTLVVPWFGGHVKPSVPCTCI